MLKVIKVNVNNVKSEQNKINKAVRVFINKIEILKELNNLEQ